jgi:hypothetical protein
LNGWIEGRTVAIEMRWAEGRSERFAEIAAEFVRLKVEHTTPPTLAAKQATSVIPIVFATGGRPGRQRLGRVAGSAGRCPITVSQPPVRAAHDGQMSAFKLSPIKGVRESGSNHICERMERDGLTVERR